MTSTYLVKFPGDAEARWLAGVTRHTFLSPAEERVQAVADWLGGIGAEQDRSVPVTRISGDLGPIFARARAATSAREQARSWGPFAPDQERRARPGQVEYLGNGVMRLDSLALASLACLDYRADFRVTFEDGGPVMVVGQDRYQVMEETDGA